MSVIAIVWIDGKPDQAFWQLQHATAYARFMSNTNERVGITLHNLDLLPWEVMLYGRQDNDEIVWEGSDSLIAYRKGENIVIERTDATRVDATTVYRVQLN